jgi:hypothetical protein
MTAMTRLTLGVVLLGIGGLPTSAVAQGADPDPLVGTWVLDSSRSRFPGDGNGPQGLTMTYEALDDGRMRFTAEIELPDGTVPPPRVQTFSYDEQDAPVEGGGFTSTRSTERISPRTVSMTFKNDAGKVVEIMQVEVSEDGSTLTQTIQFITPNGEFESVAVFDRR